MKGITIMNTVKNLSDGYWVINEEAEKKLNDLITWCTNEYVNAQAEFSELREDLQKTEVEKKQKKILRNYADLLKSYFNEIKTDIQKNQDELYKKMYPLKSSVLSNDNLAFYLEFNNSLLVSKNDKVSFMKILELAKNQKRYDFVFSLLDILNGSNPDEILKMDLTNFKKELLKEMGVMDLIETIQAYSLLLNKIEIYEDEFRSLNPDFYKNAQKRISDIIYKNLLWD